MFSNIFSNLLDSVLFHRITMYFKSLLIQFILNLNTGRTCLVAFKEMLRFYSEHGSTTLGASLDDSKVYARVNK